MSMTGMTWALGAFLLANCTVLLVTCAVLMAAARGARSGRGLGQTEQQVGRLHEGTNLLTETVELGFRQCAVELERLGAQIEALQSSTPAARPQHRATNAQVTAAVARGRSVREIAAEEQVAEGEVRLRLKLAEADARKKTGTRSLWGGATDAALHA